MVGILDFYFQVTTVLSFHCFIKCKVNKSRENIFSLCIFSCASASQFENIFILFADFVTV